MTRSSGTGSGRKRAAAKRAVVRRTQGFDVIDWIEEYCVFTNNEWIGEPFVCLDWEKEIILELFEIEGAAGRRRYRWAYVSVPKKNGKTELGAALGLYLLIGDGEPAPRIGCAAASEGQADLIFGAAKMMCEHSEPLKGVTETFDALITVPTIPGARLERIAAGGGVLDGPSWHALLCDELHEWIHPKHVNTWNVLTNGLGARKQPMILQFTTAGYDLDTVCGQQYERGKRILSGEEKGAAARSFYFYCREAPEDADHTDMSVIEACNPSFGVIQQPAFYIDQLGQKSESIFRRYFLNQWVEAEEIWISGKLWDACYEPKMRLRKDLPLFVGIDIATRRDSSAVVMAQWQERQRRRRLVVRAKIWSNPYDVRHRLHATWKFDIAQAKNYLIDLYEQFPEAAADVDGDAMPGPAFAYDPHKFEDSAQQLEGIGLNMVEFPQTDSRMVPATSGLENAIRAREIAHNGDPILRRHITSVTPKEASNERGQRISKPRGSRKHIDGAIGLAQAAALAREPVPEQRTSVYEVEDLFAV